MGRIIKSHDDLPVREYMEFLERFNRLNDCSWYWYDHHDERDRFENTELAKLRNHKGGVIYIEGDGGRYDILRRSKFTPTQTRLAAHRALMKKRSAVFMTNDMDQKVLPMLLDLDKKHPSTDCARAAKHFVDHYIDGRGYVEPSTSGKGLHVYFFMNVEFVKRAAFNSALKVLYGAIRSDETFKMLNQPFDDVPIYGIPTLWTRDTFQQWKVLYRGNELKLPYLPNGRSDLQALEALSLNPLEGQKLVDWAKAQRKNSSPSSPSSLPSNRQVAQPQKPQLQRLDEGSGQQRRAKLYREMKLKNPHLTEDEFVAAYEIRTIENGGEEKVRKDFRHMERTFSVASRTVPIDMTKYLSVVKEVVPPLAMVTPKGRTKLNHERVAQFVAVKMHDAQQLGEHQAASARDTMLVFWESLKAQGLVDWSLTKNTHSKLMAICTAYRLLEVIEEYTAPSVPGAKNGRCRRIGPGAALKEEYVRFEFTRCRLQAEAVKPMPIKTAL